VHSVKRSVLCLAVIGATAAAAANSWSTQAALTRVTPSASGAKSAVIVILRNQHSDLRAGTQSRAAAVHSDQAGVLSDLAASSTRRTVSLTSINAVASNLTAAEIGALSADSRVAKVIPDAVLVGPSAAATAAAAAAIKSAAGAAVIAPAGACPTNPAQPLLEPEALQQTKTDFGPGGATSAHSLGFNGAGTTVAFLADGVDTTSPDFQRGGLPVITQYDFSTDGPNHAGSLIGAEAEGDASSIAAQGQHTYDLSQFVNAAHPLPAGCNIRIEGVAPAAHVLSLKVFSTDNTTTTSGFVQAIDFAIGRNVDVINESFGSNPWPDTSQDAVRQADDAAVASGITVVVSSGDGGITSTQGSPATDPSMIDVGATTIWQSYAQTHYAGYGVAPGSGKGWISNNVSSISSGGFAQGNARTNDLVNAGDLGWALCSNNPIYATAECNNYNGLASPIQLFGGTSESSPLTSGAAALVIQAYKKTHAGLRPSPALVKQILTSTATDIQSPAEQQGAGLVDTLAAVEQAQVINGGKDSGQPNQTVLLSPNQTNLVDSPGAHETVPLTLTNTSKSTETVHLKTRQLTDFVDSQAGSFTINSSSAQTFPNWIGVTDVWKTQTFTVPSGADRLLFSFDYQAAAGANNNARVRAMLIDPKGRDAGYTLPQGVGNYGHAEVTKPVAGTWTAFFFTTAGASGTTSPVHWKASEYNYDSLGSIATPNLVIAPGATAIDSYSLKMPAAPGDQAVSIVVEQPSGVTNSIPITMRSTVPTTSSGGSFHGTLTGGNGRPINDSQTNTYYFNVPYNVSNMSVGITLAHDPGDQVLMYLVDPNGQTLGYSSNLTYDPVANTFNEGLTAESYKNAPQGGPWSLVLQWASPVSGKELAQGFDVKIGFNKVSASSSGLPGGQVLHAGSTHTATITVTNTGNAPAYYFVDPRLATQHTYEVTSFALTLPQPPSTPPFFIVPTHTSAFQGIENADNAPVSFDAGPFVGDPDIYSQPDPTNPPHGAYAQFNEPQLTPGLWYMNPSDVGPYTSAPAPNHVTGQALLTFNDFDSSVTSSTGDLWEYVYGLSSYSPLLLNPGQTGTIAVTITPPNNSTGTAVTYTGTIYLDTANWLSAAGFGAPNGDELTGFQYSYRVAAHDCGTTTC
jgi:hypothetical protein